MESVIYIMFATAIVALVIQAVWDNKHNPPSGLSGGMI